VKGRIEQWLNFGFNEGLLNRLDCKSFILIHGSMLKHLVAYYLIVATTSSVGLNRLCCFV
jgi:hypothetical protein